MQGTHLYNSLMKLLSLILCSLAVLVAQEPKPKTGTPPAIPVEMGARFWQARTQVVAAQAAEDAIKAELAATCGADYFWDVSNAAKPTCVARPAASKPAPASAAPSVPSFPPAPPVPSGVK